MSATLERILRDGLCSGCGACVAVSGGKLATTLTDEGFLRPEVRSPLDSADQAVVRDICPGLSLEHENTHASPSYHPLWGPVLRVATGYAIDAETRYRGSSGGVITAICRYLVESGRVSFVVSTSASTADPIGNETAARVSSDAIMAAAGSRYGPSSPLADLETHLARGTPFAFVGKPCDVAALRRMARRDARIGRLIPYQLSFFCAGVPSRNGTVAVLAALGVDEKDLVRFKYRGDGWPGFARAVRHDGTEATMDYNASWGTILNRHLQFRCKICADGTGEFADIACADAWYGKDGYPDFTERDGRSLIVARTAAGAALLAEIEAAHIITCEALDIGEIERMQPYQAGRKRNVLARSAALTAVGRLTPRYSGLRLWYLAVRHSYWEQLRNFAGTFRRLLRSDARKGSAIGKSTNDSVVSP